MVVELYYFPSQDESTTRPDASGHHRTRTEHELSCHSIFQAAYIEVLIPRTILRSLHER